MPANRGFRCVSLARASANRQRQGASRGWPGGQAARPAVVAVSWARLGAPNVAQVALVVAEIAEDVCDDRRLRPPGWSASRGAQPAAGDPPAGRLGAGAAGASELRVSRPGPPGLSRRAAIADRAADRGDGDGLGSGP